MLNEFVCETAETETQIAEVTPVEPQMILLTEAELAYVGGGILINGY